MIVAHKYHIPDECPKNCPYIEEFKKYIMDKPCLMCPSFACRAVVYKGDKIFRMSPDRYPPTLAAEWARWFEGGMKGRCPKV